MGAKLNGFRAGVVLLLFVLAASSFAQAAWWNSSYPYRRQINVTDLRVQTSFDPLWWNESYSFRQQLNVSDTRAPWWDLAYLYRQQLNVTNPSTSTVAAGYSVNASIGTTDFLLQNKSYANMADLRIVYKNATGWYDLDRINDEQNDLAASWHLDETTLFTVRDESGNENQGVFNGWIWTTGQVGNAGSFSGANYVEVPSSTTLNVQYISMEAWVYRTTNSPNPRIILNKENMYEIQIGSNAGANDRFEVAISPNWAWYDGGAVPLNQWTHVVATWDGDRLKTYVNGVQTSDRDLPNGAIVSNSNALRIGARGAPGGPGSLFVGNIDEAKVYGRALSADEIKAHYYAGLRGQSIYKGMGLEKTNVWFKTQADIAAGAGDSNYWVYYGASAPSAEKNNASNVYWFFDDFETGNLNKWDSVATGWSAQSFVKRKGTYAAYGYYDLTPFCMNLGRTLAGQTVTGGEYQAYYRFTENTDFHYPVWAVPTAGQRLYWVVARENGYWGYYLGPGTGGAYANFPVAKAYSANTWYKMRLRYDLSQNKFWVWIDDQLLTPSGIDSKDASGNFVTGISSMATIESQCAASSAKEYLDDARIRPYKSTEPLVYSLSEETQALPAGYSANVPLNTTKMVLENKALANMSDLRLLYRDPSTGWIEIDRVNDEQSDLAGSWHFDEPSGTSVADESGNGNNGALLGTVSRVVGKIGNGVNFDGNVSNYVNVSRSSSLEPAGAVAVEAWVKPADTSTWHQIVTKRYSEGNAPYNSYILGSDATRWQFCVSTAGLQNCSTDTAAAAYAAGQWYHLVGTYDGTSLKLYVDGVLKNSLAKSGTINYNTTLPLRIGTSNTWATQYFNGTIDEVKIYSRALSPSEVQAHYLAGFRNQSIYKGMALNNTNVWFKTQKDVPISSNDSNYWLYYGATNPQAQKSNASNIYAFWDDFDGTSLSSKWLTSAGATTSVANGFLTVATGAVYTTAPIVSSPQNYLFEAKVQWTTDSGSQSGFEIANAQSAQPGNGGSNSLTRLISNNADDDEADVQASAANGTVPDYNIVKYVKQFTATIGINYKIGFSQTPSSITFYKDGAATNTYAGSWNQSAYAYLGYLRGSESGFTNINDLKVNWVKAMLFYPLEPKTAPIGSEQQYAPSLGDLPAGYSINLTFDHANLVAAGKSTADGSDARVVYENASGNYELDRVNETAFNTTSTQLWFATQKNISLGASDWNYSLYYGASNPEQQKSNASKVYAFYDGFDGASLDSRWAATGSASVGGGFLNISTGSVYTNAPAIPSPQNHLFEANGKWTTGTGSNSGLEIANAAGTQSGNSGSNALAYFVTDASDMDASAWAASGTAPAYDLANGLTQFTATTGTTYTLGYSFNSTQITFYKDNAITTAYLGTWNQPAYIYLGYVRGANSGTTDGKDFEADFVRIRRHVSIEPSATLIGSEENNDASCATAPDGSQTATCIGSSYCCTGACAAQPSCTETCNTTPYVCSSGTWSCTPQPSGFSCATNSTCLSGTLVAACDRKCDGAGTCGNCTATCSLPPSDSETCNLKIILTSNTPSWTTYAPNASITVNYVVLNSSSGQTLTAGVTTNITLANGTVINPTGFYSATIKPVSQNATATESIVIQAGADGCNPDSKTISYVVAGPQKPAAAPDFDLLLLPAFAAIALLIARKRKKL